MSGPFDYKTIPLAPMVMSVHVHEKIDKQGTWAYHTVDGLYLATSTEHYRTYRCHIKNTNNERFTYILHFSLRKLTRNTITHADKVMTSIADFAKVVKNLGNGYKEMKQLVQLTERAIHHKTSIVETPTITAFKIARSRVLLDINNNNNSCQTISMTQPTQQLSTISTPVVPRVEHSTVAKHKNRKKRHKPMMNETAPAHNTRTRTQKSKTPPYISTISRTQITIMANKKQKVQA